MKLKNIPKHLVGSVATHRGFESPAGELLKAKVMNQSQIDEWNNKPPEVQEFNLNIEDNVGTAGAEPDIRVTKPKAKRKEK
jgi:hypothetical protein